MPLLTPWGTPSSLSVGRIFLRDALPILKVSLPPGPGQTLKSEAAEVRGSGTGWLEQNSALCSQRLVRAGHRSLYSIHCDGRVAPPHASAHSMGNAIIFIWGPNFEMLPQLLGPLGRPPRGGPNSLQRSLARVGLRRGGPLTKPTSPGSAVSS